MSFIYEYYDECIEYLWSCDWLTFLLYIGIIIALYFAIYLEYKDLYCPDDKNCKLGNCNAFIEGKPKCDDNLETLLTKIRISSRYDEASVYWRRCLIFTLILSLILLILILRRLPIAYELLTAIIVIYLFTFLFLVFYQENISKPATHQVNQATQMIYKLFNQRSDICSFNSFSFNY
jgi:hypothetical protein